MLTREDFKPDLDFSLKDWVQDALLAESVDKREPPQFTDESIDHLMKQVYEHIERQALEVYKSNAPWALKSWAYSNILKDTIASEATEPIVENLVSPVIEWQGQSYDPVTQFHQKLVADGKPVPSIQEYMVSVTKFVARKGRKRTYPNEDLLSILPGSENGATLRKPRTGKLVWYILLKQNILSPLYAVNMLCYRNSSDFLMIRGIGNYR